MKILTVVGARPQFIKAATISRLLKKTEYSVMEEVIVHTGQHYDANMSSAFFNELDIPLPAYNLDVGSGEPGEQIGAIMARLKQVVDVEKPDWMLVYGDTNSTLAAALVAAKYPLPLAHIEAGLRSFRAGMPEEVNRVVTDRLSQLLFCPTTAARDHLLAEGRNDGVELVGDVMYDGFRYYSNTLKCNRIIGEIGVEQGDYILATLHRAENTDNKDCLSILMESLGRLARDIQIVMPLHPRTRKALRDTGIKPSSDMLLVEPLSYLEMLTMLTHARGVITDSGGLQKEAYFARVPCVTLREETEWTETLEHGWNRLAPAMKGADEVVSSVLSAIKVPCGHDHPDFYGDGNSAQLILNVLKDS